MNNATAAIRIPRLGALMNKTNLVLAKPILVLVLLQLVITVLRIVEEKKLTGLFTVQI